jgi:DNA-binding transcriptional ArsR family regulator
MLRNLMVSKVRVKLLKTFLDRPDELFYVRQLVRETGEEINAVRRELLRMEKGGLVKKEERGNRLYYWLDRSYPLYGDLLSLVAKSVGLGGEIVKKKNQLGKIKFAVLSGRFARRLPTKEGGVDLMVVGEVAVNLLTKMIQAEENRLGREINYTVMSRNEFDFRKKRHDPFLAGILASSRIMLIGDEEDLAS